MARRKASERIEVIGRAYIAREMCIELQQEIENKLDFLKNVEHLGIRSGVNFYETSIKIRFLQGRLQLQHDMMEKSGAVIVLALEKYAQYIDHDIENYNRDLNNVMKIFTLIAVTFLP